MHPDDSQRIEKFLGGDAEVISEVDSWIRRAAWPFKRRLASDWDDILQDVRVEIIRLLNEKKFRGESSLKTYIWRVTNNACVDRSRARWKYEWEELEVVDQRGDAPMEAALADLARGESKDLMLRVLTAMSEECKKMWRLIFEGHSYRQMSEQLSVSEGALRVRVLRCRRRALEVREQLQG